MASISPLYDAPSNDHKPAYTLVKPVDGTSSSDDHIIREPPRSSTFRHNHPYFHLWWAETLCCLLALGALGAIVGVIHVHEGKPLPSWQFGLTVNAIIAIFTLVIKAAAGLVLAEGISHIKWVSLTRRPQPLTAFVAHDNASRGPWGSLTLLWKNKYLARDQPALPYISSFGALLTVFLLLLDPFSQQIIRNYECNGLTADNGTISRSNLYIEAGAHIGAARSTVPVDVRRAAINGLFATQQPQPAFTCRTGNCTFAEEYSTIAFCSACSNVTAELQYEPYIVPNNETSDVQYFMNITITRDMGENVTLTATNSSLGLEGGNINLVSIGGEDTAMIRQDYRKSNAEGGQLDNPDFNGYRCSFVPCIKTYKAKVDNGKLEENLIQENRNVFSEPLTDNNITTADLACLKTPEQRDIIKRLGYTLNETTRWIPYNFTFYPAPEGSEEVEAGQSPCRQSPGKDHADLCSNGKPTKKALDAVPPHCIYKMSILTAMSIQSSLLSNLLTGNVYADFNSRMDGNGGSEPLLAVYNAGSGNGTMADMTSLMNNVTNALTTHMRQTTAPGFTQPATGDMFQFKTCVAVRWEWLTYMGAMVGLLLVFFVFMVVFARVGQQADLDLFQDFKSSVLPVLFHGFDGESLRRVGSAAASNRSHDLKRTAEDVWVSALPTEQGTKMSIETR